MAVRRHRAGLVITATIDVIAHATFELHELRHLIAVAGAGLLVWTAPPRQAS